MIPLPAWFDFTEKPKSIFDYYRELPPLPRSSSAVADLPGRGGILTHMGGVSHRPHRLPGVTTQTSQLGCSTSLESPRLFSTTTAHYLDRLVCRATTA